MVVSVILILKSPIINDGFVCVVVDVSSPHQLSRCGV